MKRLNEQLRWWAAECDRTNSGCQARKMLVEAADRLAHYEDLEEQGRLVVLPCKIGDFVYDKAGHQGEIAELTVEKSGGRLFVEFNCDCECKGCAFNSWAQEHSGEYSCDGEYGTGVLQFSDIGTTVFLSRAEAEAALANKLGGGK